MVIKCKMCGGDLQFEEGSNVCECEFCGTMQTVPRADSEKKTNLFNRANRLRMSSEFDKASAVYEQLAAEFPEEAEAYWGLCLCSYGIEYVDDPATGKKLPTCHRTLTGSIMEDANFEQACDNADVIARRMYREEAKVIDRIQKEILSIAATEAPYDVFICYKETGADGSRTEDSVLAQDIYDALSRRGMKVFFSRITLEDKLGVQYEPYIYAALSSAKVMLAVGTRFEHYDAVWVKNEWSRFLAMMRTDKTKTLIPCFKGLDAYDMPKEFKGLQAQDMGKLGWMQDLVRGVEKLCGRLETPLAGAAILHTSAGVPGGNVDNLIKRANIFLSDGDWQNADAYFEKVLDINAEHAGAYLGKLCVELHLRGESQLADQRSSFEENGNWVRALRYADGEQRAVYEGYAARAREKIRVEMEEAERRHQEETRDAEFSTRYEEAAEALKGGCYFRAYMLFDQCGDYRDSRQMMDTCVQEWAEAGRKEREDQADRDMTRIEAELRALQKEKDEDDDKKKNLEKKLNNALQQHKQLTGELAMAYGIFNAGKKRRLQALIDENIQTTVKLRQELRQIDEAGERRLRELDEAIAAKQVTLAAMQQEKEQRQGQPYTYEERETFDARLAALAEYAESFQVGRYVTLGHYPQTAGGMDRNPIEWLVLAKEGQKALLISRCALDCQPYHNIRTEVTWESSYLRKWLNNKFINMAFSAKERKRLLTADVDNGRSQSGSAWKMDGGSRTADKVFLLSCAEAERYFKDNDARMCVPTQYAQRQGAGISPYMIGGSHTCSWWLRSPGENLWLAAEVEGSGELNHQNDVNYADDTVRPVVWVDIAVVAE